MSQAGTDADPSATISAGGSQRGGGQPGGPGGPRVGALTGHDNPGAVRVDKWLWAVRLYKTRTAATEACRGGHVRVNQASAKPATMVKPGDTVRDRTEGRERVVEVARVIEKRTGAPAAAGCYIDRSPPPPPREAIPVGFSRERGSGRPTKKDRRQLDRLRRQ